MRPGALAVLSLMSRKKESPTVRESSRLWSFLNGCENGLSNSRDGKHSSGATNRGYQCRARGASANSSRHRSSTDRHPQRRTDVCENDGA